MDLRKQSARIGPLEVFWNRENPEKIMVAVYLDHLLLREEVLTPLAPSMLLSDIKYNEITVSGEVYLRERGDKDEIAAKFCWGGKESGQYSGVLGSTPL